MLRVLTGQRESEYPAVVREGGIVELELLS
jgi:hypothetical protein